MNLKNVNFSTKFLLFLCINSQTAGMTLIELLVIIIILVIIAAIALPSFLSCGAKAKNSEGKSYVGATVRAQQAYRLEHSYFASTFTDLKIGLPTQTVNYMFILTAADEKSSTVTAISLKPEERKSFTGQVIYDVKSKGTKAMNCQTTQPSATPPIPDAATGQCITGEPMN